MTDRMKWMAKGVPVACLLCLMPSPTRALEPCAMPARIEPAGPEIADVSPRFSWAPVQGATHYTVRIESRVPEGRVLLSEETRTRETHARASRPLAAGSATVTVAVTAHCGEQASAERIERRRIDAALACPVDVSPVERMPGSALALRWASAPAASAYEVSVLSPVDGSLHGTRRSAEARSVLTGLPRGDWMVAVRPLCGAVRGAVAYLLVEAP